MAWNISSSTWPSAEKMSFFESGSSSSHPSMMESTESKTLGDGPPVSEFGDIERALHMADAIPRTAPIR